MNVVSTYKPQPRVPLHTEPMAALQQRYPDAVRWMVNNLDVLNGSREPVSANPMHVFDTEDGLRLICSLDQMPDGRIGTHVSVSFHEKNRDMRCASLDALLVWIGDTWRTIAQSTRELEFIGISDGGIPHFFVERGH